ncbi:MULTISPECIES: multidrug effflux MFS transporter [Kocuria]|uniref:Multidrug effflux MFS transporter n=1 Tax=Kocuria subflava TaxID=1736139 RepID=A0A846TJD4_9MICC|nr:MULTISPECIES: multidrug effflux MFS transporter [Kocuria]NKE08593.1 multidrug effflux MFS transporter [Kocuria subflava]
MRVSSRLGLAPGPDRVFFLLALGVLSAVSPMATDMYLASMPALAQFYGAPASTIQLSLSTYMVGMAVGQFLLGPISDVWGRHRLLVAGTSVFLLSSLGIVFSTDVTVLLVLRAIQGFAGAAGVVIARAIVSDIASGIEAAKLYSLLGTIVSVAPIVAPVLGGLIATWAPWQVVFWVLAGFGALMVACVVFVIPETLPPQRRRDGGILGTLGLAGVVVRNRPFMAWAVAMSLSFGSLFSYVSASSFVMQNVVGLSSMGYSLAFAAAAFGSVVAGLVNVRLLNRFTPAQIMIAALAAQGLINALGLVGVLVNAPDWTIVVHTVTAQTCVGFMIGNGIALAQAQVPGRAGSGSAVQGLMQFMVGGAVSPLAGLGGEHTALPMSILMFVFTTAALATALLASRLSEPHNA